LFYQSTATRHLVPIITWAYFDIIMSRADFFSLSLIILQITHLADYAIA